MKEPNKYPYQYTPGDLARYASGVMSREEMHLLEKAALDDPFLADALEGVMHAGGDEVWKDLGELEKELPWMTGTAKPGSTSGGFDDAGAYRSEDPAAFGKEGVFDKESPAPQPGALVRPFRFGRRFQIAAVIALLIGLGLLTQTIIRKVTDPDVPIAQKRSEEGRAETPPQNSSPPPPASNSRESIADAQESGQMADSAQAAEKRQTTVGPATVEQKDDANKGRKNEDQSARDLAVVSAPAAAPATIESGKDEASKTILRNRPLDGRGQEIPGRGLVKAERATLPAAGNGNLRGPYLFTGHIVDPEGKPLAFVNMRMQPGGPAYYTDALGRYRISSADSTLNLQLRAYGFQSKQIALQSATSPARLSMLPGTDPDKSKSRLKPKASSQEEMETKDEASDSTLADLPGAEPRDGWGAYHFYLLNNLRMPQDALRLKLHGTVELSFQVAPNGRLSDFRIETSLSPSCDREAIRLIREGPAWDLYNTDKPIRAKISVVF